jgi:hypothetical protein
MWVYSRKFKFIKMKNIRDETTFVNELISVVQKILALKLSRIALSQLEYW